MQSGKLFYVMGASGSGKDSLLDAVVDQLADQVTVVRRHITRADGAGGERHIAVSQEDFLRMLAAGEFCMHWQAHGLYYGISRQMLESLRQNKTLMMNGSREYLPEARKVVPWLKPVLVQVSAEVQESRLRTRGREDKKELAGRLQRRVSIDAADTSITIINNDASLQESAQAFCRLILQ